MNKIGFARVSTLEQDLSGQIKQLTDFGCSKIFSGKHSGKKESNKKQLEELISYVREDDVVVVTKLDRLGRSLSQCLKVLDYFLDNNIGFIILDQNIDTTKNNSPMTKAMIQLLGVFSELERSFIIERTQGGKRAKILAGDLRAKGGRPRKVTPEIYKKIMKDCSAGLSINQLCNKYNLSRATIARLKGEYRRLNDK